MAYKTKKIQRTILTDPYNLVVPPDDITLKLREYEWGPNPNPEAKLLVPINDKRYELGKCRLSDYELVVKELHGFFEQHEERLTGDDIAQLCEIVQTSRVTLFDTGELQNASPTYKQRRRANPRSKTQETTLTLPLNPSTLELHSRVSRAEFSQENDWYWTAPLEELRAAAFDVPNEFSSREENRAQYLRSVAVRIYVQLRANGRCEGCGQPAPFTTATGQPYLESHHTIPVSEGGPDHPHWVIAICPACHRHAHYGRDAKEFNERLKQIVNQLEPENLA